MSINIEQIAERLCTAGRINMIASGLLRADEVVPFNKLPEKVQLHWFAVAEEAVRCRAESFAGIFTKPIPEGAVKTISQTQLEAFRAQMQEADDAEYGIPVVRKLPREGQLVDARYDGVYGWRRVTFNKGHFGTIDAADGKGSQPATHWRPVNVKPMAVAVDPGEGWELLEEGVKLRLGDERYFDGRWYAFEVVGVNQLTCDIVRRHKSALLQTTDGVFWAEEFVRMHGGDVGLMMAWFCNAIETGRNEGLKSLEEHADHLEEVRKDQKAQIIELERQNALMAEQISGGKGTYGWALEAMKRGEAVRRKAWPQQYCVTIHQGASPEKKPLHDHIAGVVERSPHFDLHLPDSYQAWNPSATDQLSDDWEIVKHD